MKRWQPTDRPDYSCIGGDWCLQPVEHAVDLHTGRRVYLCQHHRRDNPVPDNAIARVFPLAHAVALGAL